MDLVVGLAIAIPLGIVGGAFLLWAMEQAEMPQGCADETAHLEYLEELSALEHEAEHFAQAIPVARWA